jgi:hypothetical protein
MRIRGSGSIPGDTTIDSPQQENATAADVTVPCDTPDAPPIPEPPSSGPNSLEGAFLKDQLTGGSGNPQEIAYSGGGSQFDSDKFQDGVAESSTFAGKSITAARDTLDLLNNATVPAGKKAEALEKYCETAMHSQKETAQLANVEQQIHGLFQDFSSGKKSIDQLKSGLHDLVTQKVNLERTLEQNTELLEQVKTAAKKAGVGAEKLNKLNETLQSWKSTKTLVGKGLYGLDVAMNFADFEKANPGHPVQNLLKASAVSASKLGLDLATTGSKLNAGETAVGLLKFGLEAMGMKDGAAYKSLDTISQALPIDIIGKGIGEFTDQVVAGTKAIGGDWKDLESLNQRNLNGANGLVMQGASIIGDLIATGGKNIPTTGDSEGLADALGVFGHTEIPMSMVGQTTEQKVGLINKLMDGSGTTEEDSLKIRNILNSATPYQLTHILAQVDPQNLVTSMRQENIRSLNPATDLIDDVCNRASKVQDPGVRNALFHEARSLATALKTGGHGQALNQLKDQLQSGRFPEMPPDVRRAILGI